MCALAPPFTLKRPILTGLLAFGQGGLVELWPPLDKLKLLHIFGVLVATSTVRAESFSEVLAVGIGGFRMVCYAFDAVSYMIMAVGRGFFLDLNRRGAGRGIRRLDGRLWILVTRSCHIGLERSRAVSMASVVGFREYATSEEVFYLTLAEECCR